MSARWDHFVLGMAGALNRVDHLFHQTKDSTAKALALQPGQTLLGRYVLNSVLGEGGMGRVWLADDLLQKKQVAFKEMRAVRAQERASEGSPDDEDDVAFKREFYTMTKLQHPNTVTVYDAGILEGAGRYIAMEWVQGQDLDKLLQKGPVPLRQVYRLLADMGQVLGFIHSRLYVHCDIKAENIRITDSGQLKLMDFGLMHQLGTPTGGTVKGTVYYMSPEMARGGIIDGRSDFYSLGILAFQLITGKLPFLGSSASELLTQHLEKPAPRASLFRDIPPALDEWVARLLAKEPRERFQDVKELLTSLAKVAGKSVEVPKYSARTSYLSAAELVGRSQEQQQLKDIFAALSEGRGQSVFVTAPAGVGKTRLLQEFRLAVKLADVPFVVGQCRAEGQMPLAAMAEALSQLLPLTPPEVLARYHNELAHLIPSLPKDEASEKARERLSPEEQKAHLFAAVQGWLKDIAQNRAFVVCLEDLHWADFGSLEIMNVVVRALQGTQSMLLGTFRSDEVDRLSIVFQTIDEGVASRIELSPLSKESTSELLSQMLRGFSPPEDFETRVFESTLGNAFFVTETLRALIERDILKLEDGIWTISGNEDSIDLPQSIQEVVSQRLKALTEEALHVCQSLAPIGRLLDLRVVKKVCNLPEQSLFALLDELVERQILQRLESDYYFVHDRVRDGAYSSIDSSSRARIHQTIGQTLEKLRGKLRNVNSALLGYHFSRGEAPDKAISYLLDASQRAAAENQALLESANLLAQAADLQEAHHPERGDKLIGLWADLVEKGFVASPPICMKYGEKLLSKWEKSFDVSSGFSSFNQETQKLISSGGYFTKRRLRRLWEERPLEAKSTHPHDWVPRFYIYRGMLAFTYAVSGQMQRSMELLNRQLADNPQPGAFRAGTVIYTSVPLMRMGLWQKQQKEAQECIDWFDAHLKNVGTMPVRLDWSRSVAYYSKAMGQAFMGMSLDESALAHGYDIAHTHQFDDILFFLEISKMVRAGAVGDPRTFLPLSQKISDRVRQLGSPRLLETRLVLNLPMYYFARRDFVRTSAVVERLEKLMQLSQDAWLRRNTLAHRALLTVEQQHWEKAKEAVDAALKAGSEAPSFAFQVQLLCAKAKTLLKEGNNTDAFAASEEALKRALAEPTYNPIDAVIAHRTHGQLLGGELGLSHLEQSLKQAQQHQLLIQEGISHLASAECAADFARQKAAAHVERAQQIFEELSCQEWLDQAQDFRLRVSGVGGAKTRKIH